MLSRGSRRALTLLEVVLAMTILVGSFAVLGQLVTIAINAAKNTRDLTRGQLLAESTMSEIGAGIVPAENLDAMPVVSNPGWRVSAVVQSTPYQGILQVSVVTQRETDLRGTSQYVLTRWMRDPRIEIPVDEFPDDQDDDDSDDDEFDDSSDSDSDPEEASNNASAGAIANPALPANSRNVTPDRGDAVDRRGGR